MKKMIKKVPSINNQIYQLLRDEISLGEIAPGAKITLREMADKFGVSTTPVREAIRRLQAENFLKVEQRYISIPKLSKLEVMQLFTIREKLESLALEWAVPHIRPVDVQSLRLILKHMDHHSISNSQWQQLNRTFHLQIYQYANSPKLYSTIENVWDSVNPYLHIYTNEEGFSKTSQIQHYKMLDLIEEKKVEELIQLLIHHFDGTRQLIMNALEKDFY
ncbi:GntR family transcriptional regulator [Niallia endozanthoxylica]|uniref:GntR family transcriptional regulator n=1 Tax=Niallia endozanthoxylica TaxID=2036016 RepID=A0A5J5I7B1_9BACI|nr:GntR family transcriptional regulator [Niallia endozanthoxylica]KAA9032373.1 GntR family transcriptional regulator [Niallia endozanthoxylica]